MAVRPPALDRDAWAHLLLLLVPEKSTDVQKVANFANFRTHYKEVDSRRDLDVKN